MKNIFISRIYKLGTLNICNFLNFSLQDVLCLNPSVTLIILFCIISGVCRFVVGLQTIIPSCNNESGICQYILEVSIQSHRTIKVNPT